MWFFSLYHKTNIYAERMRRLLNYRPISTLSALTQIFEKLICEQLVNYLERRSILYQYQFGFRKGHSTAQAIAQIADNLRKSIHGYYVGFFVFTAHAQGDTKTGKKVC